MYLATVQQEGNERNILDVNIVYFFLSLVMAILLLLTFYNRMYLIKWACIV